MSQDTQRFIGPDAQLRERRLKEFRVPYKIEGFVTIYATDAEEAKECADRRPPSTYADEGELETFPAVLVPKRRAR